MLFPLGSLSTFFFGPPWWKHTQGEHGAMFSLQSYRAAKERRGGEGEGGVCRSLLPPPLLLLQSNERNNVRFPTVASDFIQ